MTENGQPIHNYSHIASLNEPKIFTIGQTENTLVCNAAF